MTDIGREAHFAPAQTQLSVSSYFDEAIFAREQEFIFKQSALYVGHEKFVPEVGDWHTLLQERAGRALVRNAGGVELISNVCRHRQAIMLGGEAGDVCSTRLASGNLRDTGGNIVCPVHRWTYNDQGRLIGAPQFPTTPCMDLQRFTLRNCHGLLFEGPRDPAKDMAALFERPEFDFSEYVLDHIEVHECNYNWKTFIEVYLEDYHVAPFHPGLGHFVTCDDLTWEFSGWYSSQRVGVNKALAQPGSDVYRKWHDRLLEYRSGDAPDFGAVWVTYFPTHMIELYPHVVVLSTLHPVSPQKTVNIVEFYYPEDIVAFEREFVEAQRAAYMETAIEDDEIAERMDAGRKALMLRGTSEAGPYQSPMEDGMRHFHEWYRKMMGPVGI
ncbi:aromatic ring-hydroxylating oxygenase subunit alpha [Parapusillimonas granuli]|uniref:Aromatic ring-hydroxylating dioxygenase subunit alpha n=1 Tax=Parapusillimonas granuli TaxID=380911 RepID=A0A853GA64_9BURK|nr:aromatic ring-hydroxylating dioxygenase subunit alpha [Parapusillimonas granuli]MBB5216857.1 phenylpropionate dioxygenase-like ring-hydroxylating dioxygenase large terminal subunit [Parapusillimonas granuli]MEB2401502.1 aromatic ring-hydroxylating dioxygenase subunit alpha [Alcaligenaceae bacterium]NYT51656.1 aromatic ring-hydroxylating dioxygenase subunit alpha [Parapusillimonas granuli]